MVVIARSTTSDETYLLAEGSDPVGVWDNRDARARIFEAQRKLVYQAGNLRRMVTWTPYWEEFQMASEELERLLEGAEVDGCPLDEPWFSGPERSSEAQTSE